MKRGRQVVSIVATLLIALGLGATSTAASPTTVATQTISTLDQAMNVRPTSGSRTGPDSLSVDRLYRAFFLRQPDASGLAYWRGLVGGGRPLSAVALQFAQSAEFRARYGALDDPAFVHLVYRNVMGRDADAPGLAHWTGVLSAGRLSRGGVMLSFSDSAEFKAITGLVGSSVDVRVTASSAGRKELVFVDSSGRNRARSLPALASRAVYVRVNYPTASNGAPRTDRAWPMHIIGTYRNGPTPTCHEWNPTDRIVVCIGFPLMDHQSGVNWADIANHNQDVGIVLDALLGDANLAGKVDANRIVYSGASMGGVTGLGFATPEGHDPRIRAVASTVGFALWAIPELAPTSPWAPSAPAMLMVNAHDDPSITYQLARRTFEHAPAGKVTFVTIREGNGGHSPNCAAADHYVGQWLNHHMFDTPLPSNSLLTGCAVAGLLPGGSTGFGLATPWVR